MNEPNPGDYYDRKREKANRLRVELKAAKAKASCEECNSTGIIRLRDAHGDRALDFCDDCSKDRAEVERLQESLELAEYVGD